MMRSFLVLSLLFFSLNSCSIRQREKQLEKRSAELDQKEQQLVLKERLLQIKENELNSREKSLDSAAEKRTVQDSLVVSDTMAARNAKLVGNWSVRMRCTETNCTGSAVGDTKTEHWDFTYQDNSVIAKANADGKLVRIYIGNYNNNNRLQLTARHDENAETTRMVVELLPTAKNEMQGTREIFRPDGCRIVYALELKKL